MTASDWLLTEKLGVGGNAEVWGGENGEESVAVKVLKRRDRKSEPFRRFAREVEQQRRLTDEGIDGILPLLDAHIPDDADETGPAWLVMPIAVGMQQALGDSPLLVDVVRAVADVAGTLAVLARREVAHRDVKPQNLYRWADRWVVGDFGLVDAPDVEPLTTGARV